MDTLTNVAQNISEEQLKWRELDLKELEIRSNKVINIAKALITGVVVTLVPTIINFQIQNQQVEIKRLEGEVSYLERFSDKVVEQSDLTKRRNFIEYLATVAHSKKSRDRWLEYLDIVKELANEQQKIDQEIHQAKLKAQATKAELDELTQKFLLAQSNNQEEAASLKKQLKEKEDIIAATKSLLVEKSIEKEHLIEKASLADIAIENVNYTVGFHNVGVPIAEQDIIRNKIKELGYKMDPVAFSYSAGNRPSWFALRPTVLHYSSSSKKEADNLASVLSSIVGEKVVVRRGAGLGVPDNEKKRTLIFHHIM